MRFKFFLFVFLALVTLISFVSAEIIIEKYSVGFTSGTKNANPSVCLCSEFIDEIIILNNAPYPQVFEISTNLPRAVVGFNQITINPSQEIIIPISVFASCSEKSGFEDYAVFVKSSTGEEQVINRSLELKECQTIKAELFVDKNVTDICSSVEYSLKLSNPSTFSESYLIGPLKNVEFFDVNGYSVSLAPNQVSVLNFSFTPSCDISGEFENTFRVKAEVSDLSADLVHNLFINPRYDFTVFGNEELSLCRYEIIEIPYTLTNDGLVNNTYSLSLENNPSFASLSTNSVSLSPNESVSFYLKVEPGFKTLDFYDFSLIVKTSLGNEEVIKPINLSLIECFDTHLSILNPESLVVCQGSETLQVSVKNNGLYTETYNLETNTYRANISNKIITLNPGEEALLDLEIDSSVFVGKILFEVSAYSNKDLLKHWDDSIVLDIVSKSECSAIRFPSRYVVYSRFYEDNFSLTVFNKGVEGSNFLISYKGNDFLDLKKELVFIDAKDYHDVVLIKTKEHEEDVYFFALNFTADNGESYTKEFKLVLTSTPFFEKVINYAETNPCFLVALIIVVLILFTLVLRLIFGSFLGRNLTIIIVLILALIIVVSLIVQGLPSAVNPKLVQPVDPYSFMVYETKALKLDLTDFIVDPDNDTLSFFIWDEPSFLNIVLEDNLLSVSSNVTGNDRFRILADDGQGGEVITPRFLVEVVEYKSLSFSEWYEYYCVYLNMLLLLILILLILVLFCCKKKVKRKEVKTINTSKKNVSSKKSKRKKSRK